jgi:hypothetical protein
MLLIAKIAKARKAGRNLLMVNTFLPMNELIECGNRPLNSEPESFQPVFAELGKWLRAYFVGAAVGFGGGPLCRHTPPYPGSDAGPAPPRDCGGANRTRHQATISTLPLRSR